MVRVGKFSLEIIEATQGIPFKEHIHGEKTYAEVEPDAEYFLRISSHHPSVVVATMYVDGKNLGYEFFLLAHGTVVTGLWSCANGISRKRAFKFNKLYNRVGATGSTADGQEGHWTGNVMVEIYEKEILEGYISQGDFSSKWMSNKDAILNGMAVSSNKKAVNSMEGTTMMQEKGSKMIKNYKKGRKLVAITLYYCSTVGLIAAKVLSPPPARDISQIINAVKEEKEVPAAKRRCLRNFEGGNESEEVLDLTVPATKRHCLNIFEGGNESEEEVLDLTVPAAKRHCLNNFEGGNESEEEVLDLTALATKRHCLNNFEGGHESEEEVLDLTVV